MSSKITLTWGEIRNDNFMMMCQKLIDARLAFPVTVKMLTLAKTVNDERTLSQVVVDGIVKDHSIVVKEEGKPDYQKIKEELQKSFEEKMAEAMAHRFETKLDKIDSAYLARLELNVSELLAITPLLVDGHIYTENEPKPPKDVPPSVPSVDKVPLKEVPRQPEAQA